MKPELPDNRVIVPISGTITGEEACQLISELGPYVWGFKLHPTTIMRMFSREHFDIIQFCHDAKARVFVDLKGFDIPSEIGNMIRDLEEIGMIDMATVHAVGDTDMLYAAKSEAKKIGIFPVTILTTMKAASVVKIFTRDLESESLGPPLMIEEKIRDNKIKQLAALSASVGMTGTISSAADLNLFDEAPITYGNDFMIRCTPGIRPLDATVKGDDQDRVVTPAKAAAAGSDLIVVGRPISGAPDPVAAAQAIQSEFWNAKQVV